MRSFLSVNANRSSRPRSSRSSSSPPPADHRSARHGTAPVWKRVVRRPAEPWSMAASCWMPLVLPLVLRLLLRGTAADRAAPVPLCACVPCRTALLSRTVPCCCACDRAVPSGACPPLREGQGRRAVRRANPAPGSVPATAAPTPGAGRVRLPGPPAARSMTTNRPWNGSSRQQLPFRTDDFTPTFRHSVPPPHVNTAPRTPSVVHGQCWTSRHQCVYIWSIASGAA